MKLTLYNLDGTVAAAGSTQLANGGTMLGAIYRYEGNEYVVLARHPGDGEIAAVRTNPMALDMSNFTLS